MIKFQFNTNKGFVFLETLLDRVGGKYNYMALLKLAFFADRYHLRNYARPVSNDQYYAMKLGPVPSNLRDIIDVQIFENANIRKNEIDPYLIELKTNSVDKTLLSKSDMEAIDFSIDNFAKYGSDPSHPYLISNLTHAYPEWDQYRIHFEKNLNKRFDMDYLDFLNNAQPNHIEFKKLRLLDPFKPLSESDRQDIIDEITEMNLLYGES